MEICAKTLDEGEDQQQLQKCLSFPGVLEWTESGGCGRRDGGLP